MASVLKSVSSSSVMVFDLEPFPERAARAASGREGRGRTFQTPHRRGAFDNNDPPSEVIGGPAIEGLQNPNTGAAGAGAAPPRGGGAGRSGAEEDAQAVDRRNWRRWDGRTRSEAAVLTRHSRKPARTRRAAEPPGACFVGLATVHWARGERAQHPLTQGAAAGAWGDGGARTSQLRLGDPGRAPVGRTAHARQCASQEQTHDDTSRARARAPGWAWAYAPPSPQWSSTSGDMT